MNENNLMICFCAHKDTSCLHVHTTHSRILYAKIYVEWKSKTLEHDKRSRFNVDKKKRKRDATYYIVSFVNNITMQCVSYVIIYSGTYTYPENHSTDILNEEDSIEVNYDPTVLSLLRRTQQFLLIEFFS